MSNVKPGDIARDIKDGQIVEVEDLSYVSPVHGIMWRCLAVAPGMADASPFSCNRIEIDCGEAVYIADKRLRPLRDPGPEITTERETEVTA